MLFHERLAKLRDKTGMSQSEIAKRLGMARTTYAGYENGSREPDLKTLQKLSEFFQEDLDVLITGRKSDMPKEDKEALEKFKQLSEKGKDYILDLMEKMVEQKKQL